MAFGREMRTPHDVQRDLRVIVEEENEVTELLPHLTQLTETLHEAQVHHESQQDQGKKNADGSPPFTRQFRTGRPGSPRCARPE
jgi:hypothetical protein